jgi:RNA polymerase sigma-70 factor (ECF subfamily)
MNGIGPGLGLTELMTHAGWLRRLAVSLVRDADVADDVVQATLVAAWAQPPATDRDVRPWLAEVARNQAHDHRRGEGRRRAREEVAGAQADLAGGSAAASPEQLIADLEIHRAVAEVVTALAPIYRDAIVLHFFEGVSAADIARRLDVPAGTIRWRLKEGLDQVKVALDRRHAGDRQRWQRALLPLVPAELLGRRDLTSKAANPATLRAPGAAGSAARLTLASGALLAGAAALIALATYLLWPARAQHVAEESPAADAPPVAGAPLRPVAGVTTRVPRFALPASDEADPEAGRAQRDADGILKRMLAAIVDGDYDGFLERSHDVFKAALSPSRLRDIASSLAQRLRGGYEAESLGILRKTARQRPVTVHLWKLQFNDGGPDLVFQLDMMDNAVAGFFAN